MLATKAYDKDYVRNRRAHIIKYLCGKPRTLEDVQKHLFSKGYDETLECIQDDIRGFVNIGLSLEQRRDGYKITDRIEKLDVDSVIQFDNDDRKSEVTVVKERCRSRLRFVNHKYLNLIELSRNGKSNREFEIQTIAFLTNELGFQGVRLGESRKPDGVVYKDDLGAIIDNKAYEKGYNLSIKQADEMIRYLEENKRRSASLNASEWWNNFPPEVARFCFVFVSSFFKGEFVKQLAYIRRRTNVSGSAINVENLLYLGESIMSGAISRREFFNVLACNDEVKIDLSL
jgi:hypothetical protein